MEFQARNDRYDQMQYRRCGRSGLMLPLLSLGLWHNFGSLNDPAEQEQMLLTAFDHGITYFDLADNYGPPYGEAERTFGRILKKDLLPYCDELIISTKAGYRKAKGYLLSSTSLHIFVLTNACNLNCVYCQARDHEHAHVEKKSFETAEKAVMTALQSPEHYLNFEFQGGEPLLNYPVIRHIVEYAEKNKQAHSIQYSVVTNLTLLSDEMLDFFEQYDVRISTSLDGNSELHNANRSDRLGVGSFENVVAAIKKIQARNLPIGAIQTTTRQSLSKSKQIIDTYRELGFQSVFIRPLTKLGTAIPNWNEIGYSASEFVQFYRECLSYILELNKQGKPFSEGHAGIFLSKILSGQAQNYMELRSPCGAAIGQAAYYFNGDVYTCDEGRMIAEMGDSAFKLGNVYKNSYDEMMSSPVCKTVCAASVLESLPECTDCVYQPYCGTCPALNYASEHNVFKRDARGYRCQIYRGMLDAIFAILFRNDPKDIEILQTW